MVGNAAAMVTGTKKLIDASPNPEKPGWAMPTTVNWLRPRRMSRPTIDGSAPKRASHALCESTATARAPGCAASSASNSRPRNGRTPSVAK